MNWGKSIVVAFILFAGFIATLVTICIRQESQLVTRNYYNEELNYQRQIDRMALTARLAEKPSITVEPENLLRIAYTDFAQVQSGMLELFRPSDARLDRRFPLKRTTSQAQFISTAGMHKGMYRARVRWSMGGKEYFVEQIIYL